MRSPFTIVSHDLPLFPFPFLSFLHPAQRFTLLARYHFSMFEPDTQELCNSGKAHSFLCRHLLTCDLSEQPQRRRLSFHLFTLLPLTSFMISATMALYYRRELTAIVSFR
jgi:hypothetical protein